ncbi:MAG: HAD family hydrolase [Ardenticatenaceae bacterium]|nr:HAD family hydrolase [Anaerolineales bacterium]MCB8937593.1 HAD family hydrolase [Ardenticatenaceae bacterium]MCB8974162.1 HAD family hydrolase [Ardenticatenaceae bacterium]
MTTPIPFDKIQAILFDMDGTLIDTDDAAVAKIARWIRPFLRKRTPTIARWLVMKIESPANALITLADKLHLDEPLKWFTTWWQSRRQEPFIADFHLIPGVLEMLHAIPDQYRLGIVTTRSRHQIEGFLAQFPDIAPRFEVTCGSQDTRRLKPHPSPIQEAARRLGLPVTACVMVGDTTVDMHSAVRAGAWRVGVLCGFGREPELRRAGSQLILKSTADLVQLLQNW